MIDIDSLLFNIKIKPEAKPCLPGTLLVAEPFLRDTYFSHSIIWMIDCDPGEKSMGIVLNRMTGYTLQRLIDGVKITQPIPVYCGGPMSCDRLYFIHTLGNLIKGANHVKDNLYIGGDFDDMLSYINSGYPIEGNIRFFVGYSGWDVGQLEAEIGEHVWALADMPDPVEALTISGDAYWHSVVRSLGRDYRGWLYHPQNPHAN